YASAAGLAWFHRGEFPLLFLQTADQSLEHRDCPGNASTKTCVAFVRTHPHIRLPVPDLVVLVLCEFGRRRTKHLQDRCTYVRSRCFNLRALYSDRRILEFSRLFKPPLNLANGGIDLGDRGKLPGYRVRRHCGTLFGHLLALYQDALVRYSFAPPSNSGEIF